MLFFLFLAKCPGISLCSFSTLVEPISCCFHMTSWVLQIDLDNEDRDGDETGSQDIYTCNKQTGKKVRGAESDSDLDFEYRPPAKA